MERIKFDFLKLSIFILTIWASCHFASAIIKCHSILLITNHTVIDSIFLGIIIGLIAFILSILKDETYRKIKHGTYRKCAVSFAGALSTRGIICLNKRCNENDSKCKSCKEWFICKHVKDFEADLTEDWKGY